MSPHPLTNFEIQIAVKMNVNVMVFIREIIYLKQKIGHM